MTPDRTALYRIYDNEGVLLYVGVSKKFGSRWSDHAETQPWWPQASHQSVDWYDSRKEALAAEVATIKCEYPRFNIVHAARASRTGDGAESERMTPRIRATRIAEFQPNIVPGLLQIRSYTQHLLDLRAEQSGVARDGIKRATAARRRLQAVLWDVSKRKRFVLAEAALCPHVIPAPTLQMQLHWLFNLSSLEGIKVGIIPAHASVQMTPLHGFMVLDDATHIETCAGEIVLRGEESKGYEHIFDALLAEAVTGGEARRLIMSAAGRLREGP